VENLGTLPLFANLSADFLGLVSQHARYAHFSPGHVLLSQGEIPESLFVILTGHARVDCNMPDIRLPIGEFGPGDVLGFSWLFAPQKVQFNVRAAEEITAVVISGSALREICETDSASGYQVAVRMGHELLKRLHALVAKVGGETP